MDRRILYVIGAAAAAMLSSCAKVEMTGGANALDPNQIAFSVRSGLQGQSGTRSGAGEEQPAMLLGGQGEDTLYLHPSVVVNDRGFSMPDTRGVPIRDDSGISSFTVTAKVSGSDDPYMNEVEVSRQGGSDVWTTSDGKHFWPDKQTTLDFYACSNLIFAENDNPDSPGVSNLTCDGGQLGFSYIVPNGTGGSDAERQPDILFALASANRSQTQDGDGTVILNFQHALAGVQFRAKNIAGGIIRSITLKNLYGQGDCTYTLSDETTDSGARKNGTFNWSNLGGEDKTRMDFVQNMSVNVLESSTLPDGTVQDVTNGENSEKTFMMIPQSTEDVEVEIVLEGALDKKTYTVSGKLSGPGATPLTWEPGNIYIYDISTDSINWTYVFKVTPTINMVLGQTSAQYTVNSYRYRTQNQAETEPVPWTATNTSFSETNFMTGSDEENVAYDKIVRSFVYSGGASTDANTNTYQIEVHGTKMHTSYDDDEKTLRNSQPKGSEGDYYDLSTHDLDGTDISETTANCYVVNAAGYYKLPLVYGNAMKNGTDNTSAYDNSAFTDYKGNRINSPYITGADDATLVWSDGFFMFKDIKLSEDKKYLTFRIDPDYLQQANAVLAVRDADDNIMWSWHIWVTERDIYDTHTIRDFFDRNNTFELMSCNLGWVDGKNVYYNARDLTYEFTQEGSGKTATMEVSQEGEMFDYKDVGSTYYQWGRKDPLVAMRNWEHVKFEDFRLHETGRSDYAYDIAVKRVTIGEAIQHPNLYYVRGSTTNSANWCSDHIPSLWNTHGADLDNDDAEDVTTSTKTIYDPSPRYFKVPIPRAFAVFVNGTHGDGGNGGNGNFNGRLNGYQEENEGKMNKYQVYTEPNGGGYTIPFTATGQRADKGGALEEYGKGSSGNADLGGLWSMYGVYYWTCVSINETSACSFITRHDHPDYDQNPKRVLANSYRFSGTKTMARPVRPIKE